MLFEWDSKKDALNRKKHGISFKEACEIFRGPALTAEDTRQDYGEVRLISIGALAGIVVVVVVHTDRDGRVRIISARKANRKERRKYHDYLKKKT
jgi:uncharacterized protein